MEEDEEVVLEKSPFYHHLRNVGFCQVETKSLDNVLPEEPTVRKGETIDCSVVEEVFTLRAANLLFEDDLEHVDCIFANFELNKNDSLKCMFKGTASAIVLALGLCFYVYIGSYAFVLVSVFYAYRTSDYLWQKHRRLKQLKRLMGVIQSNFSLLNKVLKFLYENENMLKVRFGCKSSQRAINYMSDLKADFSCLQREINHIFADATSMLIKHVALWEYVETPGSYICNRMEDYRGCENVSQLHNVFMLLQSQFLTRLIFSLVPNLVEKPEKACAVINKVIVRVTVRLRDVHTALNKKFKFPLLNGICVDMKRTARPLPRKTRQKDVTREMLAMNIHDLSNSFQYLLIKSRELEDSLGNDGIVEAERELSTIQNELSSCHSHIADLLLTQNKYNPDKLASHYEGSDAKILDSDPVTSTEIGYPDLNPQVDDDIFEAVMDDQPQVSESLDWDREEVDPLARRKQKEMLGELKTRLKPQAEDWARRELTVLARKGLLLPQDDTSEEMNEIQKSSSGDEFEFECKLRKKRKVDCHRYGDSSSEDDVIDTRIPSSSVNSSLFAQALLQARENLISSLDEENFCCSGENSDAECEVNSR